jgi:hypothetical protein
MFQALIAVFFSPLTQAANIPMTVLFVKVCPKNIEATVFAILLGSHNLAYYILSPLFGSFINDTFIHVTNESLKLPGGE